MLPTITGMTDPYTTIPSFLSGWSQSVIVPISVSRVVRIIGVTQWH
jgi:hypothetical protein